MAHDVVAIGHQKNVSYSSDHWHLLDNLRKKAIDVLEVLRKLTVPAYVYGSLARGDVNEGSDIDIIIPDIISSYRILQLLDKYDYQIIEKKIVMATPNHAIKGQISLPEEITISFPLVPLKPRELSFYEFGGKIDLEGLIDEERVVGVDKSLTLIIPTDKGHEEKSILSMTSAELQQYGIHQEIVKERIRVLERRDKVGRTGVFLDEPVDPELGFEGTLKRIKDRNNLVRNKMKRS